MNEQLFLGSGEHSMAQCYELHQNLSKALELLSRIQQLSSHFEKLNLEEESRRIDDEAEIELLAKCIAEKLTGKKVKFLKRKLK